MERLNRLRSHSLRGFVAWLILANLLVDAAILGSVWQIGSLSRAADQRLSESAAQNIVQTLSHDIGSDLSVVDRALARIVIAAQSGGGADAARESAAVLAPILGKDLGKLCLLGADGTAVRLSGDLAAPDMEEAQRRRMLASDAVVISGPIPAATPGRWVLLVSRRTVDAGRRASGAVFAQVPVEYFLASARRLKLGRDGAISVRTDELRLVARYSPRDGGAMQDVGSDKVSDTLRRQLAARSEQGTYRSTTALDAVERINAYQRVDPFALTVIAGVGANEVFATSALEMRWALPAALIVIAVLAGLSGYLYVTYRDERHAREVAARVAREQDLLLRNELVGMSRVKNRLTTWNNEALERMFGYEPHELQHTPTRLLYLDDESWQAIGREGYAALKSGKHFRTQLRMRRKDGSPLWVDLSGAMVSAEESLWMMVDIEALKLSEQEARRLSHADALTGLLNRRGLDAWFAEHAGEASRLKPPMALACMDLDGFKPVNDEFGHEAGDQVLRVIAARLSSSLREGDLAVRLGGDEFALVLPSAGSEAEALAALERLREAIRGPIRLDGGDTAQVDASFGFAMAMPGEPPAELMRRADEALYVAKRGGKGRVARWSSHP